MSMIVGPILGFRGSKGGEWHTCALIVTGRDVEPPDLTWSSAHQDAENRADRVELKSFGDSTVWRFDWKVAQTPDEQTVTYSLPDGATFGYCVPALNKPLRIAYASCAGFSSLKEIKKVESKNAMWKKLSEQHRDAPFHLMLMGGDQVYADSVWDIVKPVRDWLDEALDVFDDWERTEFTDEMRAEVADFYFELYRRRWSQPEPAEVMNQVPSLMMWDDHDIFDGWGSYPPKQQKSKLFEGIYQQAREHFRLFQLQSSDAELSPDMLPGRSDENLSYAYRIGKLGIVALDMRSERTQERVMSLETWNALRDWMDRELEGCEHLLVMSSIPIIYVNSNMIEAALGFLPGQQDLEDDFKDQWLSRTHQEERLRFVHRLLQFQKQKRCRVTLVSGDVHVAALGYLQSARDGFPHDETHVINQLTSSGIVHPPPPGMVVYAMEKVMGGNVEELDRGITAQMMTFPFTSRQFIGARNWLGLEPDEEDRIWAKWYIEDEEEPYTKVVHPIKPPDS
jgi:hypothetical protein